MLRNFRLETADSGLSAGEAVCGTAATEKVPEGKTVAFGTV